MIPAGYERKQNNKFQYNDEESDYFDDDDEDFVFDLGPRKNVKQEISSFIDNKDNTDNNDKEINVEKSTETSSFTDTFTNQNKNITNPKRNNEIVYECNNKYYYDENDYLIDDLQHAIVQKNLDLVKRLFVKNKFDFNIQMRTNWIPLMYAVSCGSFKITKFLIDNGANVFHDDDSFSVLLCASGCINLNVNPLDLVKIIQLLIQKGVDVNSYDNYCQTSLMYACRANNLLLINCLNEAGADLNVKDDQEWTALSHAASKGNYKCVQKLLQLGADPTIFTYDYLYPFDLAQNNGFHAVKDLIKRYIRVKKIENIKNNVIDIGLSEIPNIYEKRGFDDYDCFEVEGEESNTDLNSMSKKSQSNDLEIFLNALKLNDLIEIFRSNKTTICDLLNMHENDLLEIGITDGYVRELILYESKKFHQKNWKSSGLVPIRKNFNMNCNEVIAIVNNLSRHTDYMSTNIRYISSETKRSDCELFADKFLSSKLLDELKDTLNNTKRLLGHVESYCGLVEKNVVDKKSVPIDSIDVTQKTKSWLPKIFIMSTMTVTCAALTFSYFKKKFS